MWLGEDIVLRWCVVEVGWVGVDGEVGMGGRIGCPFWGLVLSDVEGWEE